MVSPLDRKGNPTSRAAKKEKKMGVASLVLGIVALVVAWIPCVGAYALVFSIVGLILGAVGIAVAKKKGQGKGLSIAGLVCNVIATAIAVIWCVVMAKATSELDKAVNGGSGSFSKALEKASSDLSKAMEKAASEAAEKAAAELK